jgi:hypothetical protein
VQRRRHTSVSTNDPLRSSPRTVAWTLQHAGAVAVDVHLPLVQRVVVDDVVGEHLKPPLPRHDRSLGVHEHERVLVVEHRLRRLDIPLLDAPLKLVHLAAQIAIAHAAPIMLSSS